MRVVVLVLCLVAACRFDERAFGERFCTGDQDCARPDQSCIEHTCTQRACVTDIDCGADYAYACTAGGCVVRTCAGVAECALGFACSDGMCRSSFNVASVVSTSNASIAVTFDAPPDEAAAKALGNYAVSGLTITGATEIAGNTVVLATSPQTEQSYTLGVTGITRAGDHAPLSAATATFTGRTAFAVTSVIATSSISLLVTFSAPPDPTASALASYAIPGLVVGGTPVLAGNTVALATSPQRATGYTLTVAGVRRASDGEALTSAIAPFTGRDDFNVVRTRAVTSRSIEIEFDAPPNAAQATSLA
ncbi:MAG TPA: hypothetical protein VK427_23140, partial [Kofleriaceae bacterium]|nr:hypothetical protein [Kofleriaceae bacterium]